MYPTGRERLGETGRGHRLLPWGSHLPRPEDLTWHLRPQPLKLAASPGGESPKQKCPRTDGRLCFSKGGTRHLDDSPFSDVKGNWPGFHLKWEKTGAARRAEKCLLCVCVCECTQMCKSLYMFACGFCPHGHDILALYPNQKELLNVKTQSFPDGSAVKELAVIAGNTGSIPSPGRSHMPQSNEACVPQPLSLCSRAGKPQLLNLHAATTDVLMTEWLSTHVHTPTGRNIWSEKLHFFTFSLSLSPSPLCLSPHLSPLLSPPPHAQTDTHILIYPSSPKNQTTATKGLKMFTQWLW